MGCKKENIQDMYATRVTRQKKIRAQGNTLVLAQTKVALEGGHSQPFKGR